MDVFLPGPNANGVCSVFPHGGGFVSGTRRNWGSAARHFRDLGYTCACVDYRLTPVFKYPAAPEDARLAVLPYGQNLLAMSSQSKSRAYPRRPTPQRAGASGGEQA